MTFVVACGLKREARVIDKAGRDVFAVAGGGDSERLRRELDDMIELFPGVVVSSGLAGALDPTLKPGDVVLAGDPVFVAKVRAALPEAIIGGVVTSDTVVATAADKTALRAKTGAIAVDMESGIAEQVARQRGLPFGILRVISDGANEELPEAVRVGMRPDGGIALGKILTSLARNPTQLPALMRMGSQSGLAFRELGRVYDVLGRVGILGLDLGEFTLDVG